MTEKIQTKIIFLVIADIWNYQKMSVELLRADDINGFNVYLTPHPPIKNKKENKMIKLSEIKGLMIGTKNLPSWHPQPTCTCSDCNFAEGVNTAIYEHGSKCLRMNREKLIKVITSVIGESYKRGKLSDAINENLKDLLEVCDDKND